MLTTGSILLMVLVPLSALLVEAGYEVADRLPRRARGPGPGQRPAARQAPADKDLADLAVLADDATVKLVQFGGRFGITLDPKDVQTSIGQGVQQFLAPLALRTTQFLGQVLIGLLVMILAIYYFFADGPVMVQAILRLTPLERHRTQELLDQFDSVTRAIVAAMLLAAFSQAILVGLRASTWRESARSSC